MGVMQTRATLGRLAHAVFDRLPHDVEVVGRFFVSTGTGFCLACRAVVSSRSPRAAGDRLGWLHTPDLFAAIGIQTSRAVS